MEEAMAKIQGKVGEVKHLSVAEVARDEDFWFPVQQAFNTDRSIVNLNNGGVHTSPKIVMDALKKHMDFAEHSEHLYHVERTGYVHRRCHTLCEKWTGSMNLRHKKS